MGQYNAQFFILEESKSYNVQVKGVVKGVQSWVWLEAWPYVWFVVRLKVGSMGVVRSGYTTTCLLDGRLGSLELLFHCLLLLLEPTKDHLLSITAVPLLIVRYNSSQQLIFGIRYFFGAR